VMDEAELTTFQVEVVHTFFRLNASEATSWPVEPRWSRRT
jgi:hypothetical protein